METFLAYWFMGSLIALWVCVVKWRHWFKTAEYREMIRLEANASWEKEHALLKNSYEFCDRERVAINAEYNSLVEKLRQQALTPPPPATHNRRIRAGSWSEVRKASEEFNRTQAENEEARERDTAFVEK